MKRLVATIVFGALGAFAFAQAPFTIVRPLDGAKVREKVRIQIPRNAIGEKQFVGIYLDGKFVEGRILDLNGKYYEYALDTKERGIADGQHKLELALFEDMGEGKPRVMDRSSVDIVVANSTSIPVPSNGFLLRYKFRPGYEFPYKIDQRVKVSTITEAQAKLGGRAATVDTEGEIIRMLYAVDNSYGNGDGLLRMQPLPIKGRDYAYFTLVGDEGPQKYMDSQMAPVFMRVSSTGLEQFGSIPVYLPIEGGGAPPSATDLYASMPLPTLPTKRVRPGDSWQTRFQWGALNADRFVTTNSVTSKSGARGDFLGVEWENGHPCAKIKHSIAVGSNSNMPGMDRVRDGMGKDRVQLEETFWFALDLGMPIKIVGDMQIDTRVADAPPSGGGGAGGAMGGGGANGPSGNRPAAAGAAGGGGASGGAGFINPGSGSGKLNQKGGGAVGGGPVAGGQGGGPRLGGGQGGNNGRNGGPAVGSIRYLRYRIQRIQTLEI